jgi:hypothetical protein
MTRPSVSDCGPSLRRAAGSVTAGCTTQSTGDRLGANRQNVFRIYKEEGLAVKCRRGRRRAVGTCNTMQHPEGLRSGARGAQNPILIWDNP